MSVNLATPLVSVTPCNFDQRAVRMSDASALTVALASGLVSKRSCTICSSPACIVNGSLQQHDLVICTPVKR